MGPPSGAGNIAPLEWKFAEADTERQRNRESMDVRFGMDRSSGPTATGLLLPPDGTAVKKDVVAGAAGFAGREHRASRVAGNGLCAALPVVQLSVERHRSLVVGLERSAAG